MRKPILATILAVTAASALAHSGVQDPAVLARMDAMKSIGDSMKVIGNMAKGQTSFDADSAQQAAAEIARHAARTTDLFEARAQDPKSEAKPSIWDQFDDFSAKASDLEIAAETARADLSSADGLVPAVQRLGAACKACHDLYRE